MKVVQLEDFAKEIDKYTHLHIKEVKKAVVSGVARSLQMLVESSPVDTGLYAQSWDMSVDEEKVLLGNYAPHSPIIESGARPFTPPLGPLLAWAKRILKDSSSAPNYSSAVWGLARYTQAKIAREGMQPKHVLQNALPKIMENIREELKNAA